MSSKEGDWEAIEDAAERAAAGADEAWSELLRLLEPRLQVLVRYQKIGRLRRREDDLRDIVVAVLAKLEHDERKALRSYFARASRPKFAGWIRRVLHSCAVDHLRAHPEYRRQSQESDGRWVSLTTLTSQAGAADPDSLVEKRRLVIAEIRRARELVAGGEVDALARTWKLNVQHLRRIAKKGDLYEPVLELIFAGFSHAEIAHQLGVTKREVELMARYIEEFLTERNRTKP